MNRQDKTQSTLARKLTTYVVLLSLFATLASTAMQLYLSYKDNMKQITGDFILIDTSYLGSLINNVWVYNDKQIGVQLDGMLGLPSIEYVHINIGDHIAWSAGAIKSESTIQSRFDLIYQDDKRQEVLGILYVTAGLDHVYDKLITRALASIVISTMTVFLAAGSILLIFRNLVTRHMEKMAHFVDTIDMEQEGVTLRLNRPSQTKNKSDELDHVVEAINNMRSNLHESMADLKFSENKFRTLVTKSEEIVYMIQIDGTFILSEGKGLAKLGMKPGQVVGKSVFELYKDYPAMLDSMRKTFAGETSTLELNIGGIYFRNWYTPHINQNGEIIGLMGLSVNITEQKLAEEEIKASLKEKETLLYEIHHRVKNNMQVISSLLKLQIDGTEDKQIRDVLEVSRNRVYAMSAVHETLHGSDKLSEIDVKTYLSKITTAIFQNYSINSGKVNLISDIEKSQISINQAYPLGLISNELLSNSLKYAFPNEKGGEITVKLKKLDHEIELTVMDDGIGMPNDFDYQNASSLGLKLVRLLVENQLGGSIDTESKIGTKFVIKFSTGG